MPALCLPLMASNPIAGFFSSLFGGGKRRPTPEELNAQGVSFYVARAYREAHLLGENPDYGPARKLEADCLAAINAAGVGTGHSFNCGGFSPGYGGRFEFCGPDARAIFDCIRDIIMDCEVSYETTVTLHFGYENDSAHEDILIEAR